MRYNRAAIILVFIANLSHAQDATPSEREMIQQLVQQVTVLLTKSLTPIIPRRVSR
jgi:hypothetical protein